MKKHLVLSLPVVFLAAVGHAQTGILLNDNFSGLPPRMFSSGVVVARKL